MLNGGDDFFLWQAICVAKREIPVIFFQPFIRVVTSLFSESYQSKPYLTL